jgi:hypothetical protein
VQARPAVQTPDVEEVASKRLVGQQSSPRPPQARQRYTDGTVAVSRKQWLPEAEQNR